MDDEVRAAAEREVRKIDERLARYDSVSDWLIALAHFAKLGLAANPAHDDQPVDETWLREVGFEPKFGSLTFDKSILSLQPFAQSLNDAWDVEAIIDGIVPHINTRGHVRKLAAALGITLKEPPA